MVKDEIRLPFEELFQVYQKNHQKEKLNIHIFHAHNYKRLIPIFLHLRNIEV